MRGWDAGEKEPCSNSVRVEQSQQRSATCQPIILRWLTFKRCTHNNCRCLWPHYHSKSSISIKISLQKWSPKFQQPAYFPSIKACMPSCSTYFYPISIIIIKKKPATAKANTFSLLPAAGLVSNLPRLQNWGWSWFCPWLFFFFPFIDMVPVHRFTCQLMKAVMTFSNNWPLSLHWHSALDWKPWRSP